MVPLKITFDLAQPMAVPDAPIHFDALMCWAVEKRELLGLGKGAVPIDLYEEAGLSCYKASQLFIRMGSNGIRFQGMITRKYDLPRWALARDSVWSGKKDNIPDGTGQQKGFLVHDSYIFPESVHCFCVGDPDGIRDLMQEIFGLGRRSRNGWGKLRGFEIETVSQTDCHWFKRSLPAGLKSMATDMHLPAIGPASFPYWDRENWSEILEYTGKA